VSATCARDDDTVVRGYRDTKSVGGKIGYETSINRGTSGSLGNSRFLGAVRASVEQVHYYWHAYIAAPTGWDGDPGDVN
jgi:hypothetical protein